MYGGIESILPPNNAFLAKWARISVKLFNMILSLATCIHYLQSSIKIGMHEEEVKWSQVLRHPGCEGYGISQ